MVATPAAAIDSRRVSVPMGPRLDAALRALNTMRGIRRLAPAEAAHWRAARAQSGRVATRQLMLRLRLLRVRLDYDQGLQDDGPVLNTAVVQREVVGRYVKERLPALRATEREMRHLFTLTRIRSRCSRASARLRNCHNQDMYLPQICSWRWNSRELAPILQNFHCETGQLVQNRNITRRGCRGAAGCGWVRPGAAGSARCGQVRPGAAAAGPFLR